LIIKDKAAFESKYAEVEKRTNKLLISKAHVYCLQEVGNENRNLIQSLKDKGFEIVYFRKPEGFDTAIVLDKSRFKDISNLSFQVQITANYSQDVAIAKATDSISGQTVIFTSAHVPGFSFESPEATLVAEGDLYCRQIIERLCELDNHAIQVIGTDMNANPEVSNLRFDVFSQRRFQLHRSNSPTNVNVWEKAHRERELDFIFTKTAALSFLEKIKSIFMSTFQFNFSVKIEESIGFDVNKNCSDHLPIILSLSTELRISKIQQLWNAAVSMLSSLIKKSKKASF
jgi:hypothetical protein